MARSRFTNRASSPANSHARSPRRRFAAKLTAAVVALTLAITGSLVLAMSASAASTGDIQITTSSPSTAVTGSEFFYEVSWSCSGLVAEDCVNPRIEIPISLDNLPGGIEDMDSWGLAVQLPTGSAAAFSQQIVRSGTQLILILTSTRTVIAGTQESFLMTVRPHPSTGNGIGFTVGPAAFSSPSFPTVTSDSLSASVTTTPAASVDKRLLGSSSVGIPGHANFTYSIDPGIVGVWDPVTNTWSSWMLQDDNHNTGVVAVAGTIAVVDTLPAEATFVSASGGGVYDPVTHTVTWTVVDPADRPPFRVTVDLPSVAGASEPGYQPSITNTVTTSFTDTAGVVHSTTDDVTHTNIQRVRVPAVIDKCGQGRLNPRGEAAPAGSCNPFWISPVYDYSGAMATLRYTVTVQGVEPLDDVTVTDWMPCFSEPVPNGFASAAGCTDPATYLTHLTLRFVPFGGRGVNTGFQELTLFIDDGTSVTYTGSIPSLSPLPALSGGRHYVGYSVVLQQPASVGSFTIGMETFLAPGANRDMNLYNDVDVAVVNTAQGFFSEGEDTGVGVVRDAIGSTTTSQFSVSGSGIRYFGASFGTFALDPALAVPTYTLVLPAGYQALGNALSSLTINDIEGRSNASHYDIVFVPEDVATGTPAMIRATPILGTPAVPANAGQGWPLVNIRATLERTWASEFGAVRGESYSSVHGTPQVDYCVQTYSTFVTGDARDLDADGITGTDTGCHSPAVGNFVPINAAATSRASKFVRDIDSSTWLGANQIASTPSGVAEYLVRWENAGQPTLSDIVLYDLLPRVGDTGTTATNNGQRGSTFTPVFDGLSSTLPAGVSVQYSAAANPCRPEVFPSQGACTNDWTNDPASLGGVASVTALRIELAGSWAAGSSASIAFRMLVPAGTQSGTPAWNSVAQRAMNGSVPLVAAETAVTGIMMPAEVTIAKSSAQAGTPVGVGDVIEYELTAVNELDSVANGVQLTDDLSAMLQVADYNDDASASLGAVTFDPATNTLQWLGDLAPQQQVVIRFTMTATGPTSGDLGGAGASNAVIGTIGELPTNCQTGLEDGCTVAVPVVAPGVRIDKTAPAVTEGSAVIERTDVTWNYTVTNLGNEPLRDLVVEDRQGVSVTCPQATLAIGASMVCTGTGSVGSFTADPTVYRNVATVEGTGTISGDPAVDDDDWSVRILPYVPAISIDKFAPATAEGSAVPGLTTVTWTYRVTNTGNEPLVTTDVVDDQGVAVTCPSTTIPVGGSIDCSGAGSVGNGTEYTNLATVTATGAESGDPVTADDPWSVTVIPVVPGVHIDKFAAAVFEGTPIESETIVAWTYTVTNTGSDDLIDLVVTDDRGVVVTCPVTTLAPLASTVCTGSGSVGFGPSYTNVATAVAIGRYTASLASDVDSWTVDVDPYEVGIAIDKRTTDATEGGVVIPGTIVQWEYVVTNVGEEPVTDLVVVDDQGVAVTCPTEDLAPGASTVCVGSGSVGDVDGPYRNIGTATATSTLTSTPVTAQDPWSISVRMPVPAITVVKGAQNALNGGVVPPGFVVDWQYTVTNIGDERVVDLTVLDDQGVVVTCPVDELEVGATTVCAGSGPVEVTGEYTNVATASVIGAVSNTEATASATWTVGIEPVTPTTRIIKDAVSIDLGDEVGQGQLVTWAYTVVNTGTEPLTQLEVVDDQGVDVECPSAVLEVGESMVCSGTGSVGSGASYINIGSVVAMGGWSGLEVVDEDDWLTPLGAPVAITTMVATGSESPAPTTVAAVVLAVLGGIAVLIGSRRRVLRARRG